MNNYKVSVCVPVYNAELFLEETLDSLVNQTLKEIEIICVNDGSTDKSLSILERYAKEHCNIKIINQKNQGLGGARNTGIDNASGEYIGFLDADDIATPTMYEKLYNLAKEKDADIAMCNLEFYPSDVKTSKTIWYTNIEGRLTPDNLYKNIQPWNKIVRKELIDRTDFHFLPKNGDSIFIILMLHANKIVCTDEVLHQYRVGHPSMSTNYNLENFKMSVEYNKYQEKLLKSTPYKNELKDYFEYRTIYNLIQVIAVAALKNDKKTFDKNVLDLKNYNYKRNRYIKVLLKKEFSAFKYFGMIYILPINFYLSKFLMKIVL